MLQSVAMIGAAFIISLVSTAILLLRLYLSRGLPDKLVVANLIGSHVLFLFILFAYYSGFHDLLDMVLVYAFIGCFSVVVITRLISKGNLSKEDGGD